MINQKAFCSWNINESNWLCDNSILTQKLSAQWSELCNPQLHFSQLSRCFFPSFSLVNEDELPYSNVNASYHAFVNHRRGKSICETIFKFTWNLQTRCSLRCCAIDKPSFREVKNVYNVSCCDSHRLIFMIYIFSFIYSANPRYISI